MLPSAIAWIREDGHRLDSALRRKLFSLARPPRLLPCWFHGLWFRLIARMVKVPVVIGLHGGCEPVEKVLRRHRCPCTHLRGLGMLTARVHLRALQDLCRCHDVTRLWADGEIRALLDSAVPAAGLRQFAGRLTGRGVTIAVMDTGIHPHPDLEGRIIGFRDFIGNRSSPYDDNGHGTHVAGCAAGSGERSGGRYRGPAPGASLVGVKVLNKIGAGSISTMLSGLNWILENRDRYRIRILSMSLGAPAQGRAADDPLSQATSRLWQAGIVVVAAAGNEGPELSTIATPGINPEIITVGAMDDKNTPDRSDDALAAFSSRGPTPDGEPKPDILSPGVSVTALRAPGSYLDKGNPGARVGEWYLTLSGTSMATPIVSGICALLLEARPDLRPSEVKARLMLTAADWGLSPNDQGAGYIDADRLLGIAGR